MRLAQLVSSGDARRPVRRAGSYREGRAWVRVRGAFFPDLIEARPGERLRLVFRREETAPCSERVVIPSLGRSVMLPPFEDVVIDLGPLPPGEHAFGCGLGVLRGRIVVRGETTNKSVVGTQSKPVPAPVGGANGVSYGAWDDNESHRPAQPAAMESPNAREVDPDRERECGR